MTLLQVRTYWVPNWNNGDFDGNVNNLIEMVNEAVLLKKKDDVVQWVPNLRKNVL